MPRNGSGVYSKPAGTTAVSGTTIESAKYNSTIDDLVTDANTVRPIVAGGTAASTASGALVNLGLTATAAELNILDGATLTVTELNYVDGVTSAIQTQLDSKLELGTVSAGFTAGTDAQGQGPIPATDSVVVVNTTASDPSGVTLPAPVSGENGRQIIIYNRGTNRINVYPSTGVSIDSEPVNSPLKLQVAFVMRLEQRSTTQWLCSTQPASYNLAGHVLSTNLATDAIEWRAGPPVLLASKSASASATLDFTEFNNAIYRYYTFKLENVKPATDAVSLLVRFSTDAGATYDAGASDYTHAIIAYGVGGSVTPSGSSADTEIRLTTASSVGNAAGERGVTGEMSIINPGNAAEQTRTSFEMQWDNPSGVLVTGRGHAARRADQDTTAIRFLMSSGNIASGVIRMYGHLE